MQKKVPVNEYDPSSMTIFPAVLAYLQKGYSVVPLWSPALLVNTPSNDLLKQINQAKKENSMRFNPLPDSEVTGRIFMEKVNQPLLYDMRQYHVRLPTKDEAKDWFHSGKNKPNIGIITGAISKLIAFRISTEKGIDYIRKQGQFPLSPAARSVDGLYVFFKHPGFTIRDVQDNKFGIDVFGDGAYVPAPPSSYFLGDPAQWLLGQSILELQPPACRPWMIDFLKKK